MCILVFLLVMLVMIDHVLKYRPQRLIFYKNDHKYTVVIALLEEPPHLDELIGMAEKSDHEFLFVNVNQAIDASVHPEITVHELSLEAATFPTSVPILNKAYLEGYKHASNDFLLFMNGALRFNESKFLTHMANNLVEHQLYTVKESLPARSRKEGYKLFFDLFDDMESTADRINYNFFSIKRDTFELASCHETVFNDVESFEHMMHLRNITILYIIHNGSVQRVEKHRRFKPYIHEWFALYNHKAAHSGLKRMLLFLLALHLFYVFAIIDFMLAVIVLIPLVHIAFYLIVGRRARHSALAFILIPVYMLLFDAALVIAIVKRGLFKRKMSKKHA